ncbi:hypothetical protein EVAR_13261_1 [Eumeta japonica]|uniref:Uncharacterized protein n=1 Tax=Eumeta variegata TaxID=151549 RepID=A0A4C1YM66_EUMVA|nr:hypothetical protein EVAR_13261_1 [Eumeta japonica]
MTQEGSVPLEKMPGSSHRLTPAPAPVAGCRRPATTTTLMRKKCMATPLQLKCMQLICAGGCAIYKLQRDRCIRCSYTPTATNEARLIQCLDVKRWRSCQFCSETAKTKENRRNETEEEREARLQNQRTRMSTLRSGKSEERKENKSIEESKF